MAKASENEPAERNPRLLRRGDVVRVTLPGTTEPLDEVLRGVSFVLHLGNGVDVHVEPNDKVLVVPPEDLSGVADEVQAIEAAEKGE